MTVHRITFEGPAPLAVEVVTALADADGVELLSSARPTMLDDQKARLEVTAEGAPDDVVSAIETIRVLLPPDASLEISADG